MKSIAGHDWTTQGLFDLVLFPGLGFIFMNIPGLELALWFAFT
jgi:hypothetical protein